MHSTTTQTSETKPHVLTLATSHTTLQTLAPNEILPLLARYQMLPNLQRELAVDRAIATIPCTSEEVMDAYEQFRQQNQISSIDQLKLWLAHYHLGLPDLRALVTRSLKIKKFQQATWGHRLESDFLKRKEQLDQVVYSLLRVKDRGLANELYFRIQAGQQSFAEVALEYSAGAEAQRGLLGPVELGTLHSKLAQLLRVNQPGKLSVPILVDEWYLIVRLEKLIPAQLDEGMRQRLLQENFQTWLQEQLGQ